MITTFDGEFLVHPIPLEMSMNACSHGCSYCFANLRNSGRTFKAREFNSQMNRFYDGATFTARKLRQGWPVVLSNLTDPFSDNNEAFTEAVLAQFEAKGIPVFFQTKTGKNMLKLIDGMKPTGFYVTITCFDDGDSRLVEPGAPVTSERVAAIGELLKRGHAVMVGFNPLVKEWMDEGQLDAMVERLKGMGVKGFYFQKLNVKKNSVELLRKRNFPRVDVGDYVGMGGGDYFEYSLAKHAKNGGVAFNSPYLTDGWNAIRDMYPKRTLPTMHDFLNAMTDGRREERFEVTFGDFRDFMMDNGCRDFFDYGKRLDGYILTVNRAAWRGHKENQKIFDAERLLRVYWNNAKLLAISPANNLMLHEIGKDERGDAVQLYSAGWFDVDGEVEQ